MHDIEKPSSAKASAIGDVLPSSAEASTKRPIVKQQSNAKATAIGDVSRSSAEASTNRATSKKPASATASAIGDVTRFAGTRVQVHGVRIQCSADKAIELKAVLQEEWERGNGQFRKAEWKRVAETVKETHDWGVMDHGGIRKGPKFKPTSKSSVSKGDGEDSAIGEKTKLDGRNTCTEEAEELSQGSIEANPPTTPQAHVQKSAIGDALPEVLPTAVGPCSLREVPAKLTSYEILGRLGGGSYGDVYKARLKPRCRTKLPEHVPDVFVVKVMSKSLQKATQTTEQQRELRILKDMSHPNVIRLMGWRETHFNMQLFFELCSSDLRGYINKCPVREDCAKKLASGLASGLAYVHRNRILHRDLSAANVLIKCEPQPLAGVNPQNSQPLADISAALADFGCARERLPSAQGVKCPLTPDMTTIWYRAPEIFLTHDDYSYASDIWSYGIVLVENEQRCTAISTRFGIRNVSVYFQGIGYSIACLVAEFIAGSRDERPSRYMSVSSDTATKQVSFWGHIQWRVRPLERRLVAGEP